MSDKTIGLERCPFCDGSVVHLGYNFIQANYAECQTCLASVRGYKTAEEAETAWNRRANTRTPTNTAMRSALEVTGDTSDGYHTFNELYAYRRVYNALLFNQWAKAGLYSVHKSWKHSDGELCFGGGWFIVSAQLPSGQVTNHYKTEFWDQFNCEVREMAAEWDGHTPQIAFERLEALAATPTPDPVREAATALVEKHIAVAEGDVFEKNFGDGAMMTGMSPKDIYQIGYASALFGLGRELTALKTALEAK